MRNDRHTLPISAIYQESSSIRTYSFEHTLDALPGQFVMLTIFGQGEKPFSIMDANSTTFSMTIKDIGAFTSRLSLMHPGDLVSFRGPYGKPFSQETGRVLMVGGGYATPPLRYQARLLRELNTQYLVNINGARSEADLLYVNDFKDYCDRSLIATDDGSLGHEGTSVDVMEDVLSEESFDVIYISGPEKMMKAAVKVAQKFQSPFEVNLERYMKCGVGVCGSCVMDPTGFILCIEGPVVEDKKLEELSDFGVSHRDKTGRIKAL